MAPDKSGSKLRELKNLGATSEEWLHAIGISTREQLAAIGAVSAYLLIRAEGLEPSLNLLYALEGALRNVHWAELPEDVRVSLLMEADAREHPPDDVSI